MIAGLTAVLAGHLAETAKLKAYAAALYAGAAAILLFALAFALVGLRHWIVITYGAAYPDLWIALGLVIVAAPFAGFGLYMQRRRPDTHPIADMALIAGPPAVRFAASRLNARVIVIGAVLVAGVVVGRRLTR